MNNNIQIMNIVKEYCNKNFNNIEDNIFKIIEDDLDDKLILLNVSRDYTPHNFKILINEDLYNIFNVIEDGAYNLVPINDIKIKMNMMEREINYEDKDKIYVNKFITNVSLISLQDNKDEFEKYLNKNCKDFTDLLKYATIISSGWIKPKFSCVKVLLNDF